MSNHPRRRRRPTAPPPVLTRGTPTAHRFTEATAAIIAAHIEAAITPGIPGMIHRLESNGADPAILADATASALRDLADRMPEIIANATTSRTHPPSN